MTGSSTPVDAASGRLHTTWAGLIAIIAALAVVAGSFGPVYSYRTSDLVRRLCTLDGGSSCPAVTVTRSAWQEGWWGWLAVPVAVLGAVCVVVSTFDARPRHGVAIGAVGFFAAALACALAALRVPDVDEGRRTAHDLRASYRDVVVNGHAWSLWIMIVAGVVGLVAAIAHVAVIRRVAGSRTS